MSHERQKRTKTLPNMEKLCKVFQFISIWGLELSKPSALISRKFIILLLYRRVFLPRLKVFWNLFLLDLKFGHVAVDCRWRRKKKWRERSENRFAEENLYLAWTNLGLALSLDANHNYGCFPALAEGQYANWPRTCVICAIDRRSRGAHEHFIVAAKDPAARKRAKASSWRAFRP